MQRSFLLLVVAGCTLVTGVALIAPHLGNGPAVEELDVKTPPKVAPEAEAGICPWRDPEGDRHRFFPEATRIQDETFILSHLRIELANRLGHAPGSNDGALRVHCALQGETIRGYIVTRAVRGESGVIELVLAVDTSGKVLGARLQRLREPEKVAQLLQSPTWLGAFTGKTASSPWQLGQDIPAVNADGRTSAAAIIDGARTTLILLELGKTTRSAH